MQETYLTCFKDSWNTKTKERLKRWLTGHQKGMEAEKAGEQTGTETLLAGD